MISVDMFQKVHDNYTLLVILFGLSKRERNAFNHGKCISFVGTITFPGVPAKDIRIWLGPRLIMMSLLFPCAL